MKVSGVELKFEKLTKISIVVGSGFASGHSVSTSLNKIVLL